MEDQTPKDLLKQVLVFFAGLFAFIAIGGYLLYSVSAHAAPPLPVDIQGYPLPNILVNGGFENGKAGWSTTGPAFLINATTVGAGNRASSWTPSASSQVFGTSTFVIPPGYVGTTGLARCMFSTRGTGYTLKVINGNSTAAQITIASGASTGQPSQSPFTQTGTSFTFLRGTSTGRIEITSNASGNTIDVDECYVGPEIQAGASTVATDFSDWFIEANIDTGADQFVGTVTGGLTNTLWNTTSGVLTSAGGLAQPVGIGCQLAASTVGNTTCAANETMGVTFNIPVAGMYEVCLKASHRIGASAEASSIYVTNYWAEVNSTTGVQITPIPFGKQVHQLITENIGVHDIADPVHICANFYFASAGQRTVELYSDVSEVDATDMHANDFMCGDNNGSANSPGQCVITVRPW